MAKILNLIPRDKIVADAKRVITQKQAKLKGTPYFIDEEIALKVINFISLLKHTAGKFADQPFQLLPFQIEFIIDVVATYLREGGTRRYKTALLFLPRKNGKTELIAAILLFFLFLCRLNEN